MALDTYQDIWGAVLLRCPAVGPALAQDLAKNAFRRVFERKRWSWLVKQTQFTVPQIVNDGTVSVTLGSPLVVGAGTTFTQQLVGRQFRIGASSPIYDIQQVLSTTQLLLSEPWEFTQGYTNIGYQIYRCYFVPPDDFHAFTTLWDPNYNWQLNLNVDQREINAYDAQRANFQQAYVASFRDYQLAYAGTLTGPTRIIGSGAFPAITGDSNYISPANGVYAILVTGTGISGAATFTWSFNGGAMSSTVVTSDIGNALSNGVSVFWPDSVTFLAGDVFIIQAQTGTSTGLPRYELWPHNQNQYVYPFLYESRPPDLSDPRATLPIFIRGDVLMEMCLSDLARWPGTVDTPNPYFNLSLAGSQETRVERMVMELERQDDEVYEQSAQYDLSLLPYAPLPWGDARWLQSHSI